MIQTLPKKIKFSSDLSGTNQQSLPGDLSGLSRLHPRKTLHFMQLKFQI